MADELDDIKRASDGMGTSREQIEKNGADLGARFQRIAMMRFALAPVRLTQLAAANLERT